MLSVAREDDLRFARSGAPDPAIFRVVYLRRLQALWRSDREAFLTLFELATGGQDLTLIDDFGDVGHAPRRILAAALKQLAKTRRDAERRSTASMRSPSAAGSIRTRCGAALAYELLPSLLDGYTRRAGRPLTFGERRELRVWETYDPLLGAMFRHELVQPEREQDLLAHAERVLRRAPDLFG